MKKFIAIFLALTLCVAGFAACTKTGPDDGKTTTVAEDVHKTTLAPEKQTSKTEDVTYGNTTFETVKVGTGGTTGTYYAFASAVCQLLKTDKFKFEVVSTGGSQANIEGIADGDYHLATVQNDVMNDAYEGKNKFKTPIKSFSAIACIYPEVCQLIATQASGIKTAADLKGKNVAIGDAGSGVFFNAVQILEAAGLDYKNDIKSTYASFGDSATQLKDGSIDAAFITAGTPTNAIAELAVSTKVVAVDPGKEVIDKLLKEHPFYAKYEMTEKDYGFIKEPVNTVAIMATFVATNDMSEEQVYEFTKNLWENKEVKTAHAKGAEMDINNAITPIGKVPLHPGAEKYYKEVGILH